MEEKKETNGGKVSDNSKGMAVLSYLFILVLIPFFTEKNDKFVVYHAKQGLNLFIIEIICAAIGAILNYIPIIGTLTATLLGLVTLVLAIIGIVYVCNGEMKELPLLDKIKIIK